METLLKKLFFEKDGSGHKIKFGELFNEYNDYLNESDINYVKYNAPTDDEASVVSTLTLGIVAVLKTLSDTKQQKEIIQEYIIQLTNIIQTNHYVSNPHGFFETLYQIMSSDENDKQLPETNGEFVNEIFDEALQKNKDYYFVQEFMKKKYPTDLTEDYINLLTLCTFAFIQVIQNYQNRQYFLVKFLIELKEMHDFGCTNELYDKPNYRGWVSY
jgi:hypothetical protein